MVSKHKNPSLSSDEEDDSEQSDAEEQQQQNGSVEEEVEDESGEEEEDEDDDGDDDDEEKSSEMKSIDAPAANPPRPYSPSGSDSETGSDVDSDDSPPSPNVSDFTIKPITSKPMKDSDKSTPKPNNSKNGSLDTGSSSVKKDGGSGDEEEDDNGVEGSAKKGSGIQRLWNPDDETALLKGMVEYQSKNGTIMNSDMDGFLEFVNKLLHVEVTKNQLIHKIKRLKKKYQDNAEKVQNGEEPVFSKPHEGKSFELSKKIWGYTNDAKKISVVNGGSSAKNKRKTSSVGNVESVLALPKQDGAVKQPVVSNWGVKRERTEEVGSVGSSYTCLTEMCLDLTPPMLLGKTFMKNIAGLIEGSKAIELEKRWKQLKIDEAELYLRKVELMERQTKLILNALTSPKS